jgi:hypothetical protein
VTRFPVHDDREIRVHVDEPILWNRVRDRVSKSFPRECAVELVDAVDNLRFCLGEPLSQYLCEEHVLG